MTENEMRRHRCCFTGHRPQKLNRSEQEIRLDLECEIRQAIDDGYTTFITGMAYGVDIWAGEIVVRLRERNPGLHLIAAIPFRGVDARWSFAWKRAYASLLGRADLVRYICPGYHAGAYQRRNEWMVDHASRIIAVFSGTPSGTKNTVDYAERNGIAVFRIDP